MSKEDTADKLVKKKLNEVVDLKKDEPIVDVGPMLGVPFDDKFPWEDDDFSELDDFDKERDDWDRSRLEDSLPSASPAITRKTRIKPQTAPKYVSRDLFDSDVTRPSTDKKLSSMRDIGEVGVPIKGYTNFSLDDFSKITDTMYMQVLDMCEEVGFILKGGTFSTGFKKEFRRMVYDAMMHEDDEGKRRWISVNKKLHGKEDF